MAKNETLNGRFQHPKYTAAALTATNPVLLDGEVVYESDTGRHKMGNGVYAWNALPYETDTEQVPGVSWKVQGGMLYVKPTTDKANPILKRCYIGILHYKNAKLRKTLNPKTGVKKARPSNAGFKVVQDSSGKNITWTSVRINPVPLDITKADKAGWIALISVENLFGRWVKRFSDPNFAGGGILTYTAARQ